MTGNSISLYIYTQKTWITREPLITKMRNYKDNFMNFSRDGFIQRPKYIAHSTIVQQMRAMVDHEVRPKVAQASKGKGINPHISMWVAKTIAHH